VVKFLTSKNTGAIRASVGNRLNWPNMADELKNTKQIDLDYPNSTARKNTPARYGATITATTSH
jgi:hypothetical protein